jgi:hypothetical protein
MSSEVHVHRFSTDQLCEWLSRMYTREDWKDVEFVIRQQRIKGCHFLEFTFERMC